MSSLKIPRMTWVTSCSRRVTSLLRVNQRCMRHIVTSARLNGLNFEFSEAAVTNGKGADRLRRVRKRRNDEIGSVGIIGAGNVGGGRRVVALRSEEHTSELQSRRDLVCRLLLEKKKKSQKFHRRIF